MTNTPIDRESVDAVAAECRFVERELNNGSPMTCHKGRVIQETIDTLLALRAALDAAEAESKRLQGKIESMRAERIERDRAALQENPDG